MLEGRETFSNKQKMDSLKSDSLSAFIDSLKQIFLLCRLTVRFFCNFKCIKIYKDKLYQVFLHKLLYSSRSLSVDVSVVYVHDDVKPFTCLNAPH